jgi:hypothetical protein
MKGRGSDKRAAAVAGPQGGRVASLAGAEGVRGDPEVRQAAARGASYEGGALNACGNPQLTIRSGHHAHLSVGAYSSGG